jgi:sugar phosphate isomerase/epimerase
VSPVRDVLGAHVPWTQLQQFLPEVLGLGLAPEIAIKGPDLDEIANTELDRLAASLTDAAVRPTIHAPFFDLNPGALDPLVQQVTRQRLTQTLEVAGRLNAHLIVIHPGFDRWRYPNLDQVWIENAETFFLPLLELAARHDCRLAMENIYEERSDNLVQLADRLESPWFGHCFDIGHWHMFGQQEMLDWIESIAPRLLHLHLHDNHGTDDEHLPVGSGLIDFQRFFPRICEIKRPISMTLEAHTLEHLHCSLAKTQSYLAQHRTG